VCVYFEGGVEGDGLGSDGAMGVIGSGVGVVSRDEEWRAGVVVVLLLFGGTSAVIVEPFL
jgi:hypothetical protein